MATATCKAARATVADLIDLGPLLIVQGHIVWSAAADTYLTGGIVMTFDLVPQYEKALSTVPWLCDIQSRLGNLGYLYNYSTGKLQIFTTNGHGTEKTTGQALNATVDVVTDDPHYFAIFKKYT